MKKIMFSGEAHEAADKVMKFIKRTFATEVADTEKLIYWEEGHYHINVRVYFKKGWRLSGDECKIIQDAMKLAGVKKVETVVLMANDEYVTFCGYSNRCKKEGGEAVKQPKKAEFIKVMATLAKKLCKKHGFICNGKLSEVCGDSNLTELKDWIRFYATEKKSGKGGEIDLYFNDKSYAISVHGRKVVEGDY